MASLLPIVHKTRIIPDVILCQGNFIVAFNVCCDFNFLPTANFKVNFWGTVIRFDAKYESPMRWFFL